MIGEYSKKVYPSTMSKVLFFQLFLLVIFGTVAVIVVLVIVFILLYFSSKEDDISIHNEEAHGSTSPTPTQDIHSYVDHHELKGGIKRWKSSGRSYHRVISELHEEFSGSNSIGLKSVKIVEDRLVGIFFVEHESKTLQYRDIEYDFISRFEMTLEEVDEPRDTSSLLQEEDDTDTHFLVDDHRCVYLKTSDSYHKISSSSEETKRKHMISRARSWVSSNCRAKKEKLHVKNTVHEGDATKFLMSDADLSRDHYLVMEGGEVKDYRKLDDDFFQKSKDSSYLTELPFTHGIEVELQVIKENWEWVDGNQMGIVFEEVLDHSRKKIAELRYDAGDEIQRKWKGDVVIKEDDKGYEAVHIDYSTVDDQRSYSVLGKDSHVTFKTNILEIQTPPCEYLEELEWWAYNLYRIAHEVVRELNIDADILSVGTNPMGDYSEGLSFGEHHHLGIEDPDLKKEIYNTYRYMIPHFIAISSNSPFLGKKVPKYTFNEMGHLVITDPCNNMRLKENIEQFKTPPYLPESGAKGKKHLEHKLERTRESLRMIDIYPFTRFDTVEVRIFDTQITTLDRISIALLLQAIALYVKDRFQEDDEFSPSISSKTLKKNRYQSIEDGLLGRIYTDEDRSDRFDLVEQEAPHYIYEDWQVILRRLFPYFEKLGVENTPYVKNLLLRVFKLKDGSKVGPPLSPSQMIVFRSEKGDHDFEELLRELKHMSFKGAEDMRYDIWSRYVDLDTVSIKDFEGFLR